MSRMVGAIREANRDQPGIAMDEHDDPVGKDPRQLDHAELRAAGHVPMPVLKVIRAKCLECCCGSPGEVRDCIITSCPSWPYRMGSNPWRAKKVLLPEQRRALIAGAKASQLARVSGDEPLPRVILPGSDPNREGCRP